MVDSVSAMRGPTDGEWWMAAVCFDDEPIGDVAVHMTWDLRSAEIGYTLAKSAWGNGYATEAVLALVEWLFADPRLTRISGQLHPDNVASAMVLERAGFLFEGHTRLSYWVGTDNSDDWIFGMTRPDWVEWKDRPANGPDRIELVEIDETMMVDMARLKTHKTQEQFVAPMLESFADALMPGFDNGARVVPWMRAVHSDGQAVGFVMLAEMTEQHPEPYLWRLLVDRLHQRRGIGRLVLEAVVAEWRDRGAGSLLTSWGQGRGSPEQFYLDYGFVPTGEIDHGEIVGRLVLE
jgi:RimJ/RimL family protein N-acetyltransferase